MNDLRPTPTRSHPHPAQPLTTQQPVKSIIKLCRYGPHALVMVGTTLQGQGRIFSWNAARDSLARYGQAEWGGGSGTGARSIGSNLFRPVKLLEYVLYDLGFRIRELLKLLFHGIFCLFVGLLLWNQQCRPSHLGRVGGCKSRFMATGGRGGGGAPFLRQSRV